MIGDHALALRGVSFDFGQTLADLDTAMLARRVGEKGARVAVDRLDAALPGAWRAYDDAIRRGLGGHPWKLLMSTLLEGAGVGAGRAAIVDWLWSEQPAHNLWRRPISDMAALVRDLAAAKVPLVIVSNSEGRLAELIDEIGWADLFPEVVDSGRVGIEKPDARIFAAGAARLGLPVEAIAHVGDSLAADVLGALGAGMKAIWYGGDDPQRLPAGSALARRAAEVRAALAGFGLALPRATSAAG